MAKFVGSAQSDHHRVDLDRLYHLHSFRQRLSRYKSSDGLPASMFDALEELQQNAERVLLARSGEELRRPITVAVVGDFSSGKSSLLNALLGGPYCPVALAPTTSAITYFTYGAELTILEQDASGQLRPIDQATYRSRVQHVDAGQGSAPPADSHAPAGHSLFPVTMPRGRPAFLATPREVLVAPSQEATPSSRAQEACQPARTLTFHYHLPLPFLEGVRIIDTPGFENPAQNTLDTAATEEAVRSADVLFVVMNIEKGNPSGPLLRNLDRMRERFGKDHMPPAYLLISQADRVPAAAVRSRVLRNNQKKYGKTFSKFLLVSAHELMNQAQEDETTVQRAIQEAVGRVYVALEARKSFALRIAGEAAPKSSSGRGEAPYVVNCDGRSIRLPPRLEGSLASRDQLLQLVTEVRSLRESLLNDRAFRHRTELRIAWKRTLGDVHAALDSLVDQRDLARTLECGVNNGSAPDLMKVSTQACLNALIDFVRESIVDSLVHKKRVEKGFWSDTTHHEYFMDTSRLLDAYASPTTYSRGRFQWGRFKDSLRALLALHSGGPEERRDQVDGDASKVAALQQLLALLSSQRGLSPGTAAQPPEPVLDEVLESVLAELRKTPQWWREHLASNLATHLAHLTRPSVVPHILNEILEWRSAADNNLEYSGSSSPGLALVHLWTETSDGGEGAQRNLVGVLENVARREARHVYAHTILPRLHAVAARREAMREQRRAGHEHVLAELRSLMKQAVALASDQAP